MKLDVLADESSQPWYADGLSFTCTQCGNCCTGEPGYVWISDEEIGRLAAHLGKSRAQIVEQYCRAIDGRLSLRERKNRGEYDCTFLEEHEGRRICTVYPVRPLQCRTWPFWSENLESPAMWARSARRCPGMNIGRKYSSSHVEALRDAKDWPE
jgi:Fe-S-cluster containining protein